MKKIKCTSCKGRGQTKACRTEFHFEPYVDDKGKDRKQMVTDKLGSGCLQCEGVGFTQCENPVVGMIPE